jgi:hypothetical protein
MSGALLVPMLLSLLFIQGSNTASRAGVAPQLDSVGTNGPEIGTQWHATWASETDATRARELDMFEAKDVRWVRIDVGWKMLEPHRDQIDTAWAVPFVERQIDAARAHGAKVMITFWQTPGWANGGRSATTPPNDPNDYAEALAWAVKRWGGKVDAWQVWSEPNLDAFWSTEDPVQYTQLLKKAYVAAKAANPAAVIVFGGTMYVDVAWIRRAYDAGAKGHFDVMAVHPYMGKADAPPELPDTGEIWNMMHVDALETLMSARGDGHKPIYFTEFGWSVHGETSTTPPWQLGVTEAQQADYLARAVALVRSRWPQVDVMIWYNSRDKSTGDIHQDGFGLMRRDFSPRPVMNAIAGLQPDAAAPAPAPGAEVRVELRAQADATVDSRYPYQNYGAEWALVSEGSPSVRSLLKFALPAAPTGKTLVAASLKVSTTGTAWAASDNAHAVHVTSGSWSESGVTFANRPTRVDHVGQLPGGTQLNSRYTVPLETNAFANQGGQSVSLAISTSTAGSVQLVADESVLSAGRPLLVLVYR